MGQSVIVKIIEKYDIELDKWMEVKTQLNYGRSFGSAIPINNRYIYIIGGTTDTDCFEVFDINEEYTAPKCEMILLKLDKYIPWFKEMLLPFDEEGLMIFGGEMENDITSQNDDNGDDQSD